MEWNLGDRAKGMQAPLRQNTSVLSSLSSHAASKHIKQIQDMFRVIHSVLFQVPSCDSVLQFLWYMPQTHSLLDDHHSSPLPPTNLQLSHLLKRNNHSSARQSFIFNRQARPYFPHRYCSIQSHDLPVHYEVFNTAKNQELVGRSKAGGAALIRRLALAGDTVRSIPNDILNAESHTVVVACTKYHSNVS